MLTCREHISSLWSFILALVPRKENEYLQVSTYILEARYVATQDAFVRPFDKITSKT